MLGSVTITSATITSSKESLVKETTNEVITNSTGRPEVEVSPAQARALAELWSDYTVKDEAAKSFANSSLKIRYADLGSTIFQCSKCELGRLDGWTLSCNLCLTRICEYCRQPAKENLWLCDCYQHLTELNEAKYQALDLVTARDPNCSYNRILNKPITPEQQASYYQ